MSSNNNHINTTIITRDNYEEYFLLYIDDELTAAQKAAVEAFAAANPDLKAELEILADTKLTPELITLDNKEALFAAHMHESNMEESLLLYVDDELAEKEKKELESKLSADQNLFAQHQLLLKAKLDKNETIVYPYKEELYRKEEERRVTFFWWRIAAAVIVIAGAGAIAWFGGINNTDAISTTVAMQTQQPAQQQQQQTAPVTTAAKDAATTDNKTTATESSNTKEATAANRKEDFKKPFVATTGNTTVVIKNKVDEVVVSQNATAKNTITTPDVAITEINKAPQQIINTTPVTNAVTQTYNSTEAASNENQVPVYAAATPTNEKSGSVKGFLRKATRFIERRTNIKTVNSDDELLIGAVAFNLK